MVDDIDIHVRTIFSELFAVAPVALDDEVRRGELEGWDSLGHLDLVRLLETRFAVSIDVNRALEIETFGDAKRVVAGLLGHA
jgi:acyl carrier protein